MKSQRNLVSALTGSRIGPMSCRQDRHSVSWTRPTTWIMADSTFESSLPINGRWRVVVGAIDPLDGRLTASPTWSLHIISLRKMNSVSMYLHKQQCIDTLLSTIFLSTFHLTSYYKISFPSLYFHLLWNQSSFRPCLFSMMMLYMDYPQWRNIGAVCILFLFRSISIMSLKTTKVSNTPTA